MCISVVFVCCALWLSYMDTIFKLDISSKDLMLRDMCFYYSLEYLKNMDCQDICSIIGLSEKVLNLSPTYFQNTHLWIKQIASLLNLVLKYFTLIRK